MRVKPLSWSSWLIGLAWLGWTGWIAPASAAGARVGLFVGHDVGLPGEDRLRFAERDAARFRDLMVSMDALSADADLLLTGPTEADLMGALARVEHLLERAGQAGQPTSLLFYFAGHGDSEGLHLANERLDRSRLLARIASLPADLKLVLLDACDTRHPGTPRGVGAGPAFDIGVLRSDRARGLVVIRSTRAGEPAHESDALGGSVFTHYLLAALRGAADDDGDGRITLLEAYRYTYRQTVQHSAAGSSALQHPSFDLSLSGSGDLVLTEPVRASATLIVPPGPEAKLVIYHQPSDAVLAELFRSPRRSLRLAVRPGKLLIQRRLAQRHQVAQVELPFGGTRILREADFIDRPYQDLARRGGRIELHPNRLAVGFSLVADRLPGGWVTSQGLRASYTWTIDTDFDVGAVFQLGFARSDGPPMEQRDTHLGLAVHLGWSLQLGPIRLRLAVGPEGRLGVQERARTDGAKLDGVAIAHANERRTATGIGGSAWIGLEFPLAERVAVRLGLRGSIIAFRIANGSGTRLRAVAGSGGGLEVGFRF